MTDDYECRTCHCLLDIPEGMDELDEDVRFCGPCAIDEIERLRTLHADSPNRNYGDGDANSLWNRIETFREDRTAKLSDEDVRELAEWWNELHKTVMERDLVKLETLRAEVLAVAVHLDSLADKWGDVIGDSGQFHFRRCRVKLRKLAMGKE